MEGVTEGLLLWTGCGQVEQQASRPPPPNSVIHLPFIIVNTSKKTVIDCSISNDK